ncbi:hypothetical protein KCU62_g292, partial [Aureobasidium sp. EXF-3399]
MANSPRYSWRRNLHQPMPLLRLGTIATCQVLIDLLVVESQSLGLRALAATTARCVRHRGQCPSSDRFGRTARR